MWAAILNASHAQKILLSKLKFYGIQQDALYLLQSEQSGGSNYDSLFVRTVAFPVQIAYWIKEVIAPCEYSVPCQL